MEPINLLIKPASSLCNLRCKYCFYFDVAAHREQVSYGIMETELLEKIVKKTLSEAAGYCSFAFQGGEPTLAGLDFYKKLIEFQKKYNHKNLDIYNSIQTNGYLLDENWAEFFSENNFLVGISLDGNEETHDFHRINIENKGSFKGIMKTIKIFDKYDVKYNILTVVTDKLTAHTEEVYKFFKENNFGYLQFIPSINSFDSDMPAFLSPSSYSYFLKKLFDLWYEDFISGTYISIRDFNNYINMLKGYPPENCAMKGRCEFYYLLEADGSVYPCDFYVLDKWKLGNLIEDSYSNIKNNLKIKEFEEMSYTLNKKCTDCEFLYICRGGCRRYREQKDPYGKNFIGLNYFCDSYKDFFSYALERMKNIAGTY
jgi:uncharacterized protein